MEAQYEDQTPVGTLADTEGPEHGAQKTASEEALAFMSSVGEFFSVYFPGYSDRTAHLRVKAPLGFDTSRVDPKRIDRRGIHVSIEQKIENDPCETEL